MSSQTPSNLQPKSARELALNALISVIVNKKPLSVFSFTLANNTPQPFAQALSYGVCRHYFYLLDIINAKLNKTLNKKDSDVLSILLLGAYEILYLDKAQHAAVFENVNLTKFIGKVWAKNMVNAILRNIIRDEKIVNDTPTHHNHPAWLLHCLQENYPQHWQKIVNENNQQAPMTLRIATKYSLADYQTELKKQDINSSGLKTTPQALILSTPQDITLLPGFSNGDIFVQDCAAQLAAYLTAPFKHSTILDACAAPGGKTTHLAELNPQATISALDNNAKRLSLLTQNINRSGANNINIIHGSATAQTWWDGILFDAILLDAPCSATGVIRRHPDIKLLRTESDVKQLINQQQQMLDNLWSMLKKGGILIYITCSIIPAENEKQIEHFIKKHHDAQHLPVLDEHPFLNELHNGLTTIGVQILPQYEMDGFFYAKLRKQT